MYLPLAERLMEKYVEEKKVEAEAGMNHWQDEECVCACVNNWSFADRGKTVYDCFGQVGKARKGAGCPEGRAG